MKILIAILTLTFSFMVSASAPPAQAAREIDHLLSYLATSKCDFNRNGTWYSPAKAKAHLSTKYKYLSDNASISSAEFFIDEGASKSSVTGRPYRVRCADGKETDSGVWLKAELARYRASTTDHSHAASSSAPSAATPHS